MTAEQVWACRRPSCGVVLLGDDDEPSLTFLDRIDAHMTAHLDAARRHELAQLTACHDVVDEWVADQQAAADDVAALADVVTPSWSDASAAGPAVVHASPAHARARKHAWLPPRAAHRRQHGHVPALGIAIVLALAVLLALASLVVGFASVAHPVLRGVGAVLGVWALLLVALVVRAAGRAS